ncbi:MAG: type II toxin-antitoxin system VapC family toxin, partial [Phycisphaerales bacterium]
MNYLLDTDICVFIIKGKSPAAMKMVQSKPPEEIAVSAITLAELEYGVLHSRDRERNRAALQEFLFPFVILDFDRSAAAEYGRLRSLVEAGKRPIGPIDLLLAAQAKSRGLVFVTD